LVVRDSFRLPFLLFYRTWLYGWKNDWTLREFGPSLSFCSPELCSRHESSALSTCTVRQSRFPGEAPVFSGCINSNLDSLILSPGFFSVFRQASFLGRRFFFGEMVIALLNANESHWKKCVPIRFAVLLFFSIVLFRALQRFRRSCPPAFTSPIMLNRFFYFSFLPTLSGLTVACSGYIDPTPNTHYRHTFWEDPPFFLVVFFSLLLLVFFSWGGTIRRYFSGPFEKSLRCQRKLTTPSASSSLLSLSTVLTIAPQSRPQVSCANSNS